MRTENVGNKNIAPTSVDKVFWVSLKFQIPPFGCKAIHGRTGLLLMGYKLNVMTHSLEKKSPQFPLGVEVLSSYATLTTGSNRITAVLRNNTNEWVEIQKGVPIARMVTANMIPPADLSSSPVKKSDSVRMSEEERQRMLFKKLDLSRDWRLGTQKQPNRREASLRSTMTCSPWKRMRSDVQKLQSTLSSSKIPTPPHLRNGLGGSHLHKLMR